VTDHGCGAVIYLGRQPKHPRPATQREFGGRIVDYKRFYTPIDNAQPVTVATTKVSRNGQVVIPKEIRERLGLQPGDSLIAAEVDGRIVLSPARREALRQEFEGLMAEFDRVLRGLRLPEEEVVRIVRRVRRGR